MTTLNTIIEEEMKEFEQKVCCTQIFDIDGNDITEEIHSPRDSAIQRAYEAGYKLAVEHLKEAYAHNAMTTVPEAIEWLEDNSKYQDKK